MSEFDKLNYDVIGVIFSFLENSGVIFACKYFYKHRSGVTWNYKNNMKKLIKMVEHIRHKIQSLHQDVQRYELHDECKYGRYELSLSCLYRHDVFDIFVKYNMFNETLFEKNVHLTCYANAECISKQYDYYLYNDTHPTPGIITEFISWYDGYSDITEDIIAEFRKFIWTKYWDELDNIYDQYKIIKGYVKADVAEDGYRFK